MRRLLIVAITVVAAACGITDSQEPFPFSGRYALRSIDGNALPHDYACNSYNPNEFCDVTAGYVDVLSPTELGLSITIRSVIRHSPTDSVTSDPIEIWTPYTYRRFSNFVTVTAVPGYGNATFTFVLGAETLTRVTSGSPRRRFVYVPVFTVD